MRSYEDELTAVKIRHPLAVITWPSRGLTWKARSNSCFPSDHFYTILHSKIRTMFLVRAKLNLFQNQQWTVPILCLYYYFFLLLFQFKFSVHPGMLLHSFFKISVFISCCSWSEACVILAFPPHPFVACDNIRFSSLFAAGDVSYARNVPSDEERGETDVFAG